MQRTHARVRDHLFAITSHHDPQSVTAHSHPPTLCHAPWYTLPPRRASAKTLPRRLAAQYGRARHGPPRGHRLSGAVSLACTWQSRLKCPNRLHRKHLASDLPPAVRGELAGFLSTPRAGVGGVPGAAAPAEPDGPAGPAGPAGLAGPGPATTWSAHRKWPHVPHL
jgi:hypothetical protein